MAKAKKEPSKLELVAFVNRHELEKVLLAEQADNLAAQSELLRAQAAEVVARTARENKQYS